MAPLAASKGKLTCSYVVLRTTMSSNAEPADRIPSPISRGYDLPMVSFLPHLKELRFGGMYAG